MVHLEMLVTQVHQRFQEQVVLLVLQELMVLQVQPEIAD